VGLASQGATVVIGDVGDLAQTSELIADTGSQAVAVPLDISDPAVIDGVRERIADELGGVDILVNNAAIFESVTWDDLDFDLWRRIMAVNLNGPMLMCKAFVPLMHGRGWGRIINMASATVAIASPVSIAYRTTGAGAPRPNVPSCCCAEPTCWKHTPTNSLNLSHRRTASRSPTPGCTTSVS
jgi:3-oxoacyl-[acyl-carrier protein] reductase